jgi:hypothetical protein
MTKQRKLRSNYQRLDDQIGGSVVDAIMISPRSSGRLSFGGGLSKDKRHPRHEIRIDAAGPGVTYEQTMLGSQESYSLVYEVNNFRDSPSFARIELVEE